MSITTTLSTLSPTAVTLAQREQAGKVQPMVLIGNAPIFLLPDTDSSPPIRTIDWGLEYLSQYNDDSLPCPKSIYEQFDKINVRLSDKWNQRFSRISPLCEGIAEGMPDAAPDILPHCLMGLFSGWGGWQIGLGKCLVQVGIGALGFESTSNRAASLVTSSNRFHRESDKLTQCYKKLGQELIAEYFTSIRLGNYVNQHQRQEYLRLDQKIRRIVSALENNRCKIVADLAELFFDPEFSYSDACLATSHLWAAVKIINMDMLQKLGKDNKETSVRSIVVTQQLDKRVRELYALPPPPAGAFLEIDESAEMEMKIYFDLLKENQELQVAAQKEREEANSQFRSLDRRIAALERGEALKASAEGDKYHHEAQAEGDSKCHGEAQAKSDEQEHHESSVIITVPRRQGSGEAATTIALATSRQHSGTRTVALATTASSTASSEGSTTVAITIT